MIVKPNHMKKFARYSIIVSALMRQYCRYAARLTAPGFALPAAPALRLYGRSPRVPRTCALVRPETLAAFCLLELTLCLIPGPAVLLTLSYALRRGLRGGLAAATGILAGNTSYFVLSAIGVVALLLASYRVFTIVKWAGVVYLAYLGVRALFARRGVSIDAGTTRSNEGRRAIASGFVTQVSIPKRSCFSPRFCRSLSIRARH